MQLFIRPYIGAKKKHAIACFLKITNYDTVGVPHGLDVRYVVSG